MAWVQVTQRLIGSGVKIIREGLPLTPATPTGALHGDTGEGLLCFCFQILELPPTGDQTFTKVPIKGTLTLLQQIFPEDIEPLFQHCLTTSYFQWDNEFYEQTNGVVMGNPLSLVIANVYTEHFEKQALASAPFTPTVWF